MRWCKFGMNAVGARGTYQVAPLTRDGLGFLFWLTARGHDGLQMLAVGAPRPFPTAGAARDFADRVDRTAFEATASGA